MTFSQAQLHAAEAFILMNRKNLEDKDYRIPREVWLVAAAMQEGAPQWQPIETAPKDGRHIMARASSHASQPPTSVHWFGDGWHLSVNALGDYSDHGCSHLDEWMPIPPLSHVEIGWRDIGSAPKDGTRVLVCAPGHLTMIGAWLENIVTYMPPRWWSNGAPISPDPTHWMPLPPPPSSDPKRAAE